MHAHKVEKSLDLGVEPSNDITDIYLFGLESNRVVETERIVR